MRFLPLCISVLALTSLARAENPLFGRVLAKVVCEADETQSYALYVPSNYSSEQRWPVIFCFDPRAHGLIPVERLRGAAEKYGYILAGSLNSRNGPYPANVQAAQAMVKDVSAHFSIDPQQVYTAGMSGGARVATGIALSGVSKGVIACGAGFPALEAGVPLRVPFVFFGIVGIEDFNFGELRRLDDELAERNATHHIATFEGGHVWSPEPVLAEAVEWLELQAMRAGRKPANPDFIRTTLGNRTAAIQKLSGLERWRALKAIAADFAGLIDVGEWTREANALGASREIKEAVKSEKRLLVQETELVDDLRQAAAGSEASKQRLVAKLRQRMDTAGNPAERLMLRRAITGYCSISRETARDLIGKKDYHQAAALLDLAATLRPEEVKLWIDLSCAYGLAGDRKRALESLDRAADAGFDDVARLEKELAFDRFHSDPRFKEILAKVGVNRTDATVQLPPMKISSVLATVELRLMYQAKSGSDFPPLSFLSVVSVRPGSAAAKAGMAPGMEITSIQGCRIYDLTEGELYNAMAQTARGEIVFTVRDSPRGNERTMRMPLEKTRPASAVAEGIRDEAMIGDP
ncbi:MAG: hypothetical protein QM760_04105 [Nibricoccus sp.]